MISVVVPVYKNSDTIAALLQSFADVSAKLDDTLEVVFVVDGSPDDSYERLRDGLPGQPFRAQLLRLSRNFGSFAAIRAGLEAAKGQTFAVLAADLQEPPDLVLEFSRRLRAGDTDIVIGSRVSRADPLFSRLSPPAPSSSIGPATTNRSPSGQWASAPYWMVLCVSMLEKSTWSSLLESTVSLE